MLFRKKKPKSFFRKFIEYASPVSLFLIVLAKVKLLGLSVLRNVGKKIPHMSKHLMIISLILDILLSVNSMAYKSKTTYKKAKFINYLFRRR